MVNDSMFVIAVLDLQKSVEFYREILDFDVSEMGDPGWRMFVKDSCHIIAGECADAIPPYELGDHSYFCYLVVDNASEYYQLLLSRKAEVIKELKDEPWGMKEFALRTIDGHRIMVGERLS